MSGHVFGNGWDFHTYRASKKKLQGRLSEFDTVYASHNALTRLQASNGDVAKVFYHLATFVHAEYFPDLQHRAW